MIRFIAPALLTAALLAACSGEKPAATSGASPSAAAPASTDTAVGLQGAPPSRPDGATISGIATLEGPVPQMPVVGLGGDPVCDQGHQGPIRSEEVVADASGHLANVLVYLKPEEVKGTFTASKGAMLDQKGCVYVPHVQAVMVGQQLSIRNDDQTMHNVHGIAKVNDEFNTGQPMPMTSTKTFDKAELPPIKFKCDVHGWMNAWVAVMPHPYFAVTKSDGSFTIPNVPPGTYTLMAWQEKYGTQSQPVTVAAKETRNLTFTFK